jgi:hypothetical protein
MSTLSEISKDGAMVTPQGVDVEFYSAKTQANEKALLAIFRQHQESQNGSNPTSFELKEVKELAKDAIIAAWDKRQEVAQMVDNARVPLTVILTAVMVSLCATSYLAGAGQLAFALGVAVLGLVSGAYGIYLVDYHEKQAEAAESDLDNQVMKICQGFV